MADKDKQYKYRQEIQQVILYFFLFFVIIFYGFILSPVASSQYDSCL